MGNVQEITQANNLQVSILQAATYTKIELEKGPVAALTQLAADLGAGSPIISELSPTKFQVLVPGMEIVGAGYTRGYIAKSGRTAEAAAANLLQEFLNPQIDVDECKVPGRLQVAGNALQYTVDRAARLTA